MLNARLFKFWHDLPEALRSGKPQNEIKHGQKGMFEELYEELPRLEQFMGAMTGLSRINFEAFAEQFDFSAFKTLCDVGGATGLLSIEVAKRHPHLKCTSFDLPPVEPIARKHIAAAGLSGRIGTAAGDFFKDPLPKADLITMGMILHDWNLEKKMHLIRSAYEALPAGGALVAIEALIDDARRENAFGDHAPPSDASRADHAPPHPLHDSRPFPHSGSAASEMAAVRTANERLLLGTAFLPCKRRMGESPASLTWVSIADYALRTEANVRTDERETQQTQPTPTRARARERAGLGERFDRPSRRSGPAWGEGD